MSTLKVVFLKIPQSVDYDALLSFFLLLTTVFTVAVRDMKSRLSLKNFKGKRLLERHSMVHAALEEEMKKTHALSIKKAQTPQFTTMEAITRLCNSNQRCLKLCIFSFY